MSAVFEGKVRRLGNSMAVMIPEDFLEEMGARKGDIVKLSVPMPRQEREVTMKMAGIDVGSWPFKREKADRA